MSIRGCLAVLVAATVCASAPTLAASGFSGARNGRPPGPEAAAGEGRALEFTTLYFVEAWDFNGRARDRLAGGTVTLSLPVGASRWSVLLEFAGMHVQAPRAPDAFLAGPSLLARMRIGTHGRTAFFAEIGAGASYATRPVPARGTRFNYLLQAGGGLQHPLGRRAGAIIDLRHFHLSNGNLNGAGHNPDVQALGGHVGMWIRF